MGSIYENRKGPGNYTEDLRDNIPRNDRGYPGKPALRGVDKMSFLVGEREVKFSTDWCQKLGEISEFLWEKPDETPRLQVSLWENTLKSYLLDYFKALN